jgi:pilus assembly protein Flp/PilA
MANQVFTWLYLTIKRSRDDRGASLVEYALLIALIAIVCIGAVQFLGGSTSTNLSSAGNSI